MAQRDRQSVKFKFAKLFFSKSAKFDSLEKKDLYSRYPSDARYNVHACLTLCKIMCLLPHEHVHKFITYVHIHVHVYTLRVQLFVSTIFCLCNWRENEKLSIYS